jgi:hypothetical protein
MTANAAAVTKVLTRYNFAKTSFVSRQVSSIVWVTLSESIAYNNDLYLRTIEVLGLAGYEVEPSGRFVLKVSKVA